MNLKVRALLMSIVIVLSVFYGADASNSRRTFEGCWTFFPAGSCRAVYREANGNYSICGKCDASGNPGGGSCSPISQQTLAQGYWCS